MSTNIDKWNLDFDKWADAVGGSVEEAVTAGALTMFGEIVERTPVDTGRLRGNWQIGINTVPSGELERTGDPSSTEARKLGQFKDGYISFVNNLPYAPVAEFGLWGTGDYATDKTTGDGYSIQAPYGMVRVTVANFKQAMDRAIEEHEV